MNEIEPKARTNGVSPARTLADKNTAFIPAQIPEHLSQNPVDCHLLGEANRVIFPPCPGFRTESAILHRAAKAPSRESDDRHFSEIVDIVRTVKWYANATAVLLSHKGRLHLPPFAYLRPGDRLRICLQRSEIKAVFKLIDARPFQRAWRVKLFPSYSVRHLIELPPHKLDIVIRERLSRRDWNSARILEQFHYRGRGFNRIVGRRAALVLEVRGYGIVGYGILSSTVSSAKPRFRLFNTTFGDQMRSRLINKLVRIPRIVIHPEFRGIGLGALMAKHLVQYAATRWDIAGYKPIMVEVIASMTDYHRFFQSAGFVEAGRTGGTPETVAPTYGEGSFAARANARSYQFFADGRPKPYLVFPLSAHVRKKVAALVPARKKPSAISVAEHLKGSIKLLNVSVSYRSRNVLTDRGREVRDAFSVDSSQLQSDVLRKINIIIRPRDVVLLTGASGSGKSTLLNLLTGTLRGSAARVKITGRVEVLRATQVAHVLTAQPQKPLIDQVGGTAQEAISILNSVGLSEAHLYVKTPAQLSDGQRYRFALARLTDSRRPVWVADEFAATLDSLTAAIVTKGMRRIATRRGVTLIVAAAHSEHFVPSLRPTMLVSLSSGRVPIVFAARLQLRRCRGDFEVWLRNLGHNTLHGVALGTYDGSGQMQMFTNEEVVSPGSCSSAARLPGVTLSNNLAIVAFSREGVGDIVYID